MLQRQSLGLNLLPTPENEQIPSHANDNPEDQYGKTCLLAKSNWLRAAGIISRFTIDLGRPRPNAWRIITVS